VHAVLVARGGKLVFERYFRGFDEIHGRRVGNVTFDADTLNDMKSVSKSVASLAVGIAIDRGLIGSVSNIAKLVFQVHGVDADGDVVFLSPAEAALCSDVLSEAAAVPGWHRGMCVIALLVTRT
jgi:Beta-lactamase